MAYADWGSAHLDFDSIRLLYCPDGEYEDEIESNFEAVLARGATEVRTPAVASASDVELIRNFSSEVVQLGVTTPTNGYEVIDKDGSVLTAESAGPPQQWVYELRRSNGAWCFEKATYTGEVKP